MKPIAFVVTICSFLAVAGLLVWKDHWISGLCLAILLLFSIHAGDGK